jgi:hypothetical protein
MRLLLWLYPKSWRDRYRSEMEALLDETRPTPKVAWDLMRGGLDARLHPGWRLQRSGRRLRSSIGRVALVLALVLAVGLGGFVPISITGQSRLAAAGAAISFGLGVLLISRRPRLHRRRRSHDCDDDHDSGAEVPARPRPGAPPALASLGSGKRSGPE